MRKMNEERGITLIALVVTIVVLLILAGITITYVLSDGGIFAKAQEAGSETIMGQIRDQVSIALVNVKTDAIIAGDSFDEAAAKTSFEEAMPAEQSPYGAVTFTFTTASTTELAGSGTVVYDGVTYNVEITSYLAFTVTK